MGHRSFQNHFCSPPTVFPTLFHTFLFITLARTSTAILNTGADDMDYFPNLKINLTISIE